MDESERAGGWRERVNTADEQRENEKIVYNKERVENSRNEGRGCTSKHNRPSR